MQQALLATQERTGSVRRAFVHDKISNNLEDNTNFWKEMRKLELLSTTDGALHGFSPDELNTHFSSFSVSPLKDPPNLTTPSHLPVLMSSPLSL